VNTDYAKDLWGRACNALKSAEALLSISPDDAASRAYYAAFHAVSAGFAVQEQTFTRHTALRAAVHRDWVKTGLWSAELGEDVDALWEFRDIGDYGGGQHVTSADATAAVEAPGRIVAAMRSAHPVLEG
jgi:uncharacterized protein (UPF0332 family)